MPPEPRPGLAGLRPVVHGAIGASELEALAARGVPPGSVVDFSASTNPLGPPPAGAEALRHVEIGRYPDRTAQPLRLALAARLGLDPDQILAANGSSELIWLAALVYARPAPERVLVVGPTYGEYERAAQVAGAAVVHLAARAENGFRPDCAQIAAQVRRERPRMVWLCNPNNPTSISLPRAEVETILAACIDAGALLVVDEAYLAFVDEPGSLLDLVASEHLLLLRSMTKDYALAGLRLGYAIGTQRMAGLLRAIQPPWSVNAAAQAAGLAALEDGAHLERAREEVRRARAVLVAGLETLGLRVTPPAANFILVEVGEAAAVRARLLEYGCAVRDCTSFGLPRHVRIAVRTQPECARLLAAFREVLAQPAGAARATPAAGG
jgi:histidinol-phosphate aminotransferase